MHPIHPAILNPDDPTPVRGVGHTQPDTPEDFAVGPKAADLIRAVVDILSATRHTFKSKQIMRARELLDSLLRKQEPMP
jgi:hypothetical protein